MGTEAGDDDVMASRRSRRSTFYFRRTRERDAARARLWRAALAFCLDLAIAIVICLLLPCLPRRTPDRGLPFQSPQTAVVLVSVRRHGQPPSRRMAEGQFQTKGPSAFLRRRGASVRTRPALGSPRPTSVTLACRLPSAVSSQRGMPITPAVHHPEPRLILARA